MNKLELPDNALTEVIKSADKHVGQTYDNLTQPVSQSTGTGLGCIVDLVFSPFKYLNEKSNLHFQHKLKEYKKELEEKEKSIPADKKTEPDFQAVSLALDNSKFCITNDELRKMFVNLIGNTMNSDMKDIAHPAFSEIIKQMTSLDAIILESFTINESQPIIEIRRIANEAEGTYDVIYKNYYIAPLINSPFSVDSYSISISNLERLGLVKTLYDKFLHEVSLYDKYQKIVEKDFKGNTFQKGIVTLTQVGTSFIKACLY